MKPILWVDAQILKFFTKIAKDFNWLTGKDNYFLARFCIVLACAFLVVMGLILPKFLLVAVMGSLGILLLSNQLVTNVEKEFLRQSQKAAKNILFNLGLLMIRYAFLLGSVFIFFAARSRNIHTATMSVSIFCLSYASIGYLVSIDKPPFKKSQAWQKVKSWFSPGLTQPQAEPIPVRSN